ncbi:hypothetical protein BJAS_P4036 [Bathymodiolus japonicus methanotrophic gill symbiont]|nr:hypothetical protein BJAS_P4036 [Bathymodiolus japonicus methanotrophic gill symbiont]
MTQLQVQRYQFNCQVQTPFRLNDYSGSMLRGAFGRALRKLACVTKMDNCKACLLYRQCTYPKIFETPAPTNADLQRFSAIPNPFIVEPPPMGERNLQVGEEFSFGLVLIGQAIPHLPLIIYAWQEALQQGLGKSHAKAALQSVIFEPGQLSEQVIYSSQQGELLAEPQFECPLLEPVDRLKLRLLTPLRIQQRGRVLSHAMQGRDFLMALVRRYYLLQEFHSEHYQAPDFSALAQQAEGIQCKTQFHWYEWQRYSSRQKQKMVFGGVLGELELEGDLADFLPILALGQWLHVGNKTTFGMGRYLIDG